VRALACFLRHCERSEAIEEAGPFAGVPTRAQQSSVDFFAREDATMDRVWQQGRLHHRPLIDPACGAWGEQRHLTTPACVTSEVETPPASLGLRLRSG
jgi:hypothetical protein